MHATLCDIPADISEDELDRRIDAFGAGHFGASPTITLRGRRFRYVEPDAVTETASAAIVAQDRPAGEAVPLRRRA